MLKKFSQCIGLASLILVMNYGALLGGGADVRMHVPFALRGIVYAQLIDIALLGLALFALVGPLWRTRFYPWVQLVLAITVPPYLIGRMSAVLPFPLVSGELIVFASLWAAIVLLLFLRFKHGYRRLLQVGNFAGIFLAVFAVCSVGQLLFVTLWRPGPYQHRAVWGTAAQPQRRHALLVWIVFDELSYDQVYGRRSRDLALPNFDALRSESTVFSDAQPIGDQTVKVIPSLLSGQAIDRYRFTFNNRLKVGDTGAHRLHLLDGAGTVFADAKLQGWRTAAVGWYNPYCTIYASAIDDCYWMNRDMIDGPMTQDQSIWQNSITPLQQVAEQIVEPARARRDVCSYDVRQRYKTYIDLEQHTSQLLHAEQADFIFLHLPAPHSPNIWSRKQGDFTQVCGSSYLDNLALADRELGSLLGILQRSPRWKETSLIVEGDHSWRMHVWDHQPAWTVEDGEASHDFFDSRPAVIVHQAGQTQTAVFAAPWPLVKVHAVVEQILRGEVAHY